MISGTILVIDDEAPIRLFLEKMLSKDGHKVTTLADGQTALNLICMQEFDLVLLDLRLQDMNGIDVLTAIHRQWPDTIVIILTGHGSLETAVSALRHGGHDYLFKPCKTVEIRESVRRGLQKRQETKTKQQGSLPTKPTTDTLNYDENGRFLQIGELMIDIMRHVVTFQGTLLELSPTEFDILAYLVNEFPRVVPPQELVREVQGYSSDPDEASDIIRYHIYRLRRKIESVTKQTSFILTVRTVGYTINKDQT